MWLLWLLYDRREKRQWSGGDGAAAEEWRYKLTETLLDLCGVLLHIPLEFLSTFASNMLRGYHREVETEREGWRGEREREKERE